MADELEFGPCSALLVIWIACSLALTLIIGAIAAAVCMSEQVNPLVGFIPGWLIPMAPIVLYQVLYFQSIRYQVDGGYVVKAYGVLWKARRSVPLEKITNIDVRQGPLERVLGFGQVWIFTPSTGAATPEEKLVGVVDPHGMKQTIIDRSEAAKQSPAAAPDAARPAAAADTEVASLLREILRTLQRIEGKLGGSTEDT